ncbi:MAG TPA: Chromate resistance protein ChrB, partial [Leptolinea sp.]
TFLTNAFDTETEADILERFRQDRAEEYAELKEQCAHFLAEIDKEIQRKNFSFAEFEENEVDLNKLESWFKKVQERDFIGGDQASEAAEWLEKCRDTFQNFSTEVFTNENPDHTHKMRFDPGKLENLPTKRTSETTEKSEE